MQTSRRTFLQAAAGGLVLGQLSDQLPAAKPKQKLTDEVGITTGSFMRHLTVDPKPGKMRILDLPKIMRDELDMRVIDLMTRTLASFEPKYIDDLRNRAEKAGCIITNLKMNQKGLDLGSPDTEVKKRALDEYKRTIDVAERLGCRWVRPIPGSKRPDLKRLADGYRELIEYAAPKKISLLIENNGWISNDPNAIPAVIGLVGNRLAASPDTGNWTNAARYAGLAKAFPLAVTCDYKAFPPLGPNGEHARYDLKRCFQIGWDAGFRGPWCLEHFNDDLKALLGGFAQLRDMLRQWTKTARTPGKKSAPK